MDLSVFNTLDKSEEGSWMAIKDFESNELDCAILVLGPDSADSVKISDEEERVAQKQLADMFTSKQMKVLPKEEPSTDKAVRKACKLTKNWRNIQWEGKDFPYSDKNAELLYTKGPFIRGQVLRFYNDRTNLTKAGLPNSKEQSGSDSSSTSQEVKTE